MAKKLTEEEVLRRFRDTHGDKYDYPLFKYEGTQKDIEIFCKKCKIIFLMQPFAHWRGQGCKKCGYESNRISLEEAIVRDKEKHGDTFTYLDQFVGTDIFRLTKCNRCQYIFSQKPNDHWNGSGCRKCAYKKNGSNQKLTETELISKSNKIFGHDKFIYPKTYLNFMVPINIKCNTCLSIFSNTLSNHFNSSTGCCPTCRVNGGFNKNESGIVYYIKDIITGLYKTGITNGTIKSRYGPKAKEIKILKTWFFEDGSDAYELEQFLHSEFSDFRLLNENFEGFGPTEFFNKDILNLDNAI